MEKDPQTDRAIIPDEEKRDLSLPVDMIRSGLELALHIEKRQGIQPLQVRKEYMVRGRMEPMQWIRKEDGSYRLGGPDKSMSAAPLYLVLSVDPRGVHVSCAPGYLDFTGMEGNEDRFRLLNATHDLNPFTIPLSSLSLFYNLASKYDESDLTNGPLSLTHLTKESLNSISFTLGPSGGAPGYKGNPTREANPFFDESRHFVETVLIYISLLQDPDDDQSLVRKDPPLKLGLMAIDQDGMDDRSASRELYLALLEAMDPGSAQKPSMSIQELYKNSPASASDQKDWRQWVVTYDGKEVKDRGRFESVSIHPREGKLFLIMNVSAGEPAPGTSKTRVALWVEDAHGLELGEREGSFRLDGTKWIQLGETYTFHGNVSRFGWRDSELKTTEFKDLIIVKVQQKDLQQA